MNDNESRRMTDALIRSHDLGFRDGHIEGRRVARELDRREEPPTIDHMPWFQANREYNDGYNAGIAAAACLLTRQAEALPDDDYLWAPHKRSVLLAAVADMLAMIRPDPAVAPPSE